MRRSFLVLALWCVVAAGPAAADPCEALRKDLEFKIARFIENLDAMAEWHAKAIAYKNAKGVMDAGAAEALKAGAKEFAAGACDAATGNLKSGARSMAKGYMQAGFGTMLGASGVDLTGHAVTMYENHRKEAKRWAQECDRARRKLEECCKRNKTGGSGVGPKPKPTPGPVVRGADEHRTPRRGSPAPERRASPSPAERPRD